MNAASGRPCGAARTSTAGWSRAWAAVLAAGGPPAALAVGRTAARLHGLPLVDDDDPALGRRERTVDDVAVVRHLHGTSTLRVHDWSYGHEEHGTLRGCPVPSLLRTLYDLRLVLRPDALVCVLDAALHQGRVTSSQLAALSAARPGARGSMRFAQALAVADGRAESPLETVTRLLLLPAVAELVPQVEVLDAGARLLARVDLGVERWRFGVEADGGTHDGRIALARDRRQERRMGWTLERVTWWEARAEPGATTRRVQAAERARTASLPPDRH